MTSQTVKLLTLLSQLESKKPHDTTIARHCRGLKLAILNENIETLPYQQRKCKDCRNKVAHGQVCQLYCKNCIKLKQK